MGWRKKPCCRVKFAGQDASSTGFGAKRYKGITWRNSHGVEEETKDCCRVKFAGQDAPSTMLQGDHVEKEQETSLPRKVHGARCPVYGVWREALQGDHVEKLAWGGVRNFVAA